MADQLIQLCSLSSGWPLTCTLVACTGCKPVNQRGLQSAWLLISNETKWMGMIHIVIFFFKYFFFYSLFPFFEDVGSWWTACKLWFRDHCCRRKSNWVNWPRQSNTAAWQKRNMKKRAVKPRVTHIILSNSFLDAYMTEWFRLTNPRKSRKRHNGRSHLEQVRGRFSVCY